MKQYYFDTSVLLVYTLVSGIETECYPLVKQLFSITTEGKLKAITSFYALHEVCIFALENAPDLIQVQNMEKRQSV